ncbi:MAG: serine protease [Pseudomonadota bacterium]
MKLGWGPAIATAMIALWSAGAAAAQDIDYGDDTSQWAKDGECDDPRFQGVGMADVLVEADLGRDASDCREGVEAGRLTLVEAPAPVPAPTTPTEIDFGDDTSMWANDGECDDKRFEGAGMTTTPLLDEDVGHDATDCRTAFEAGDLTLATGSETPTEVSLGDVEFGDDSGQWPNDNECDDPRFTGDGVAFFTLPENIRRDATDCRAAMEAGLATFTGDAAAPPPVAESLESFGTGFVVSSNGHVLTNAHVVDGCDALRSPVFGELTLLGQDRFLDLALLKGDPPTQGFARISGATGVRLGEDIVIAGYPLMDFLEKSSLTISTGTVSSRFGMGDTPYRFQISAPVHGGNSGGPVFDRHGDVVGVVVSTLDSQSVLEETGNLPQNINFAISLEAVNQFLAANPIEDGGVAGMSLRPDGVADIAEFAEGVTGLIQCFNGGAPSPDIVPTGDRPPLAEIDFGDDASNWANNGECDDKRFAGPGMTETLLIESDVGHDATDCRTAYQAGQLSLAPADAPQPAGLIAVDDITFGDDTSAWANNGECDDNRFQGEGMASILIESDTGHDATDCLEGYQAGRLTLVGAADPAAPAPPVTVPAEDPIIIDDVDFGDNTSTWANDGECDDNRFFGEGMAGPPNLPSHVGHDANDCSQAWQEGKLVLRTDDVLGIGGLGQIVDDIDFGDNSSQWADDGQCDDMRFEGAAMASGPAEQMTDRRDCLAAYVRGDITLKQ